jgi:hypothetical protein
VLANWAYDASKGVVRRALAWAAPISFEMVARSQRWLRTKGDSLRRWCSRRNGRAGWRPVRFVVRGWISAFDTGVRWWRRAFFWCALRGWGLVARPLRGCLGLLRQAGEDCARDAAQCEHWVSLFGEALEMERARRQDEEV